LAVHQNNSYVAMERTRSTRVGASAAFTALWQNPETACT